MITIKGGGTQASADVTFDLDAGTCTISISKPGQPIVAVGPTLDAALVALKAVPVFAKTVVTGPQGP